MNNFLESIKILLAEAYTGTTQQSWFSDHGAGSGLFATLEKVSAEDASGKTGHSSIAAHTNHLRWSLAMSNALMRGQQPSRNWAESWEIKSVTTEEWAALKNNLHLEYETLITELPNGFDPNNPMMTTVGISLVAHAAYHLGAIRQMIIL